MARFGRTQPTSTHLGKSTGRYEGEPPRITPVGAARSEEYARPVNRAPGEVRRAGEVNSVLPVQRVRSREVGTATSYDAARQVYDKPIVSDAMFAEAITSTDRQPVMTLRADWDRDGQYAHALSDLTPVVESVTVERELQGDLPPEVGQIEGYAAASVKAALSGAWPDQDLGPAQVFAPYRTDSPLYGKPIMQTPIVLDTGFVTDNGPRYDRRFTGTIRRVSPRSSGRTVALDAMDSTFRLRTPITLPGAAIFGDMMTKYGGDKYVSRINSQWLVDYILRQNGIYATPPPRDNAILSVTGHGGTVPEIGWGGADEGYYAGGFSGQLFVTDAPFNMIATFNMIGRWWTQSTVTAAAGAGIGLSMWHDMAAGNGTKYEQFRMHMTINATWWLIFGIGADGRPYVGLDGPGTNDEITVSPTGWTPIQSGHQWVFMGAHLSFTTTGMTVRWRIGGQLYTNTVTIPTRASNIWTPGAWARYDWNGGSFTNLQMWLDPTPPPAGEWSGESWQPQADLDPGANELTGLPELLAADGWTLIKEICAAEASRFQFTETGRPQFRTRIGDAARGAPTVSETIPASKNLSDLVSTTDESTVRNVVNLKTKKLLISDWKPYFKAPAVDTFDTPPGQYSYDVELPSAAYEIPLPRSTFGGRSIWTWYSYGGNGFIYANTPDEYKQQQDNPGVGQYIHCYIVKASDPLTTVVNGVQIRVIRLSPWQMRIIINNQQNYTIRFATQSTVDADNYINDGEPALTIPARIVEAGEEQLETLTDPTSIGLYGTSSFDIGGSGSRWVQSPEGLRPLAAQVLATTKRPMPVLDAVDVPHDPRRRIGQRIVLADPDGLGTVTATIVGISTTYTSAKATDRITVRPVTAPG